MQNAKRSLEHGLLDNSLSLSIQSEITCSAVINASWNEEKLINERGIIGIQQQVSSFIVLAYLHNIPIPFCLERIFLPIGL